MAKNAPPGNYPEALTERRLSGKVVFACLVQNDGTASNLRVLGATHVDFVLPALSALTRWEFTPAQQGDLAVSSELRTAVSFDTIATSRSEVLAANAITSPDGTAPLAPPLPQNAVDPVWPHELLMKGEGGSASVEFTVDLRGQVTGVKVREATHPAFGHALAAAMEQWTFNPAMDGGRTIAVPLVKHAEFKAEPLLGDSGGVDQPRAHLLQMARAGTIPGGAGLDEKLVPLYRVAPVYPAALRSGTRPKGEAVIEFVIDQEGRARLPCIMSASQEEFGWAAATAVSQWVFKAPLRAGKPTEVKVQIPFVFSPPEI